MANTTTNYGWVKPVVGGDNDAWGGELNTDLDGIDGTVFSVSGVANAAQSAAANALPKTGGTMSGPIVLAADPAATMQPATKQYVDAKPVAMNDNRIINGDMRIDQRNAGASGTASGYTIDRWQYNATQAGKGTWGRAVSGPSGPAPLSYYCLKFTSSSAYALLAGDSFLFGQGIEADFVGDFAWGTASAQSATLSFWVYASQTGTFGGAIQNWAATRSYPFSYSIPTANSWTKIAITIPGDTAGAWVMNGNAGSVWLAFDLGSGSTHRGPANAWASANYAGSTGAQSIVAINGATFYLTDVKLEIGSVATPYPRQSLTKSMADCQRYYQVIATLAMGYGAASASMGSPLPYMTMMRAAPTAVFSGLTYSNCSAVTAGGLTTLGAWVTATVTAVGGASVGYTVALSAEL